ncbi:hypothetical protein NA78x_000442 [Anatilimnocola sp. NA78]|uniref:hypothetical protein n=1 Tax=Anatilimnocola sp. NA78 TaxID=3415683 RepID=UPI003CE5A944
MIQPERLLADELKGMGAMPQQFILRDESHSGETLPVETSAIENLSVEATSVNIQRAA